MIGRSLAHYRVVMEYVDGESLADRSSSEGEGYLQRALRIDEKALGPHPNAARLRDRLRRLEA